jgi:hypothetical protein
VTHRWFSLPKFRRLKSSLPGFSACVLVLFAGVAAHAGGPKYVAGVSYFNPANLGQPVTWANGQVRYFVDQGSLGPLSNAQAVAMVDSAAALWSAVPTAAVKLTDAGPLGEDVNGSDVLAGNGFFAAPSDVTPSATGTPVAVIFDSDGSVIDALEGVGASQPDNCALNGPLVWIDNFNPNATFAHGVIVLNGRCATSANLLATMSYQLERAFGRILGLDFSQVNDNAQNLTSTEPNAVLAWPIMQPVNHECGPSGGTCIPSPGSLQWDDVAALNRLYPVTTTNLDSFQGKQITAANTVSIQGTVSFRSGQGMQGVNVVARPLDANGNPLYQYTITFVSGSYFAGNHGNPVTGWTDTQGNRLDRFGGNDPTLEGFFDLSGMPLPPGVTSASYQVSFEAVNPLYSDSISVGPYLLGSPAPSGTLATLTVNGLQLAAAQTLALNVANSASGTTLEPVPVPIRSPNRGPIRVPLPVGSPISGPRPGPIQNPVRDPVRRPLPGPEPKPEPEPIGGPRDLTGTSGVRSESTAAEAIGTEIQPQALPSTGAWTGRLAQVGETDWLTISARGNRIFTVVTQALDETGTPSAVKAMPAIGVWDGFAPTGTAAAGYAPAANGLAAGETWLQVGTSANEIVRIGIADQRGDGRPDYAYRGWVLYADTVSPARLPAAGGVIVIQGTGFRTGDTIQVGGVAAQVTSILPTEITAVVPPAGIGVTGSLDVTVSDLPAFSAIATIPGGISYDSASGDALTIVTAPQNQVPINVPQAFSVIAKGADGTPAGGVTVLFAVTSGTATLSCGQSTCAVTTTGDGRAAMNVMATSTSVAVVTASLTNGSNVQAHFSGVTPPALTALTPTLYLAAGATIQWPVQALVINGTQPAAGYQVVWQSASGIVAGAASTSNASGMASSTLTVGPLAEGQTASSTACVTGTSVCVTFQAFGSRPEFATVGAVSGTSQSMAVGTAAAPVVLRVFDMDGNAMAGGTVAVSQSLYAWTPACPPHGRCDQPQLLASQTMSTVSAMDGTVSIAPLTIAGVPTNLKGIAATGNSGSLTFTVEQHP